MFERIFGRRKGSSKSPEQGAPDPRVERPYEWKTPLLIPHFAIDPTMEELAQKLVSLAQEVAGLRRDGPDEELAVADAQLREMEEGEVGQKLRNYVRPYMERELPDSLSPTRVHPSEYNRVYAAAQLKLTR